MPIQCQCGKVIPCTDDWDDADFLRCVCGCEHDLSLFQVSQTPVLSPALEAAAEQLRAALRQSAENRIRALAIKSA